MGSIFGTWAEKVDLEPTGNMRLAMMRGDLRSLSILFKDTENPAAAWLCWYLAQKWQMPAPQPVADAVNRFAEQIATLAIQALDGNVETVINADIAGALWDTSPKKAKDGSRRGTTGLAEQLFFSERDFSLAFRIHELRKSGLTKDKAIEKAVDEINAIDEAKKKNAKGKKSKNKKIKSKNDGKDDTAMSFDNADRIFKKYRKDFLAGEAVVKEEFDAWARENEGR